jgi:predicted phosphodiesterase
MATTLRAGVLADLHLVKDTSRRHTWQNEYDFAGLEERCELAHALFARHEVDVVLLLGDLADDGDLPMLRRALRLGSSEAPTFVVGGNHDGVGRLPRALSAEPGAARLVGARGRRLGGLRLAGLPVTRRREGRWASTRRPAVAEWGRGPVVFASHFPVIPRERALRRAGLRHPAGLVDRERVRAALDRRRGPTVVLHGHLHVRDSVAVDSILQISCGALVEPPFDATLITLEVDGGSVTVGRAAHELGQAREQRDPRMVGERQRWRFAPGRGWRAG